MILNVGEVVLLKALQARQNHSGRFEPNGAICRIFDVNRGVLDELQRLHGRCIVQDAFQQLLQDSKADAAWYTFAAGLCMTDL